MKHSYLKAIDNLLTDSKFINSANDKLKKDNSLDSVFFHAANDKILLSNTFKKFSNKILLGKYTENKEMNDIYYLNDDIIDSLCEEIEKTLTKSYQMNDIYNDQLNEDYKVTTEKDRLIEKKLSGLKDKYEDLNILYDDTFSLDKEKKQDVQDLKKEFEYELINNAFLENKFKSTYKVFSNSIPDNKEFRLKFITTYNQVLKDLIAEKEGSKEIYKPELKTVEEDFYYQVRRQVEFEKFGEALTFYDGNGLFFDTNFFVLDRTPVIYVEKDKFRSKKIKYTEKENEIYKLNKFKSMFNKTVDYSFAKSFNIGRIRMSHIMNRFVELFGNSSDIIYPEGFRHLENFEIYQQMFPKAVPKDYQAECKFLFIKYISG